MNKVLVGIIIIVIVGFVGFLISNMDVPEPLEEDPVVVAEDWVMESATTYTERNGSDLEHVDTFEVEDGVYEITFSFDSASAGYGPVEDDEMAAQVITPHTIVVTVEDGEVVNAVTDGEYDEIDQEMIDLDENDEETSQRNVYFYVVEDDQEAVVPVEREVLLDNQEELTLLELLEGPTQDEVEDGYQTAIDEETTLNSLSIEEGVAYADFSSHLDVSGSAWVTLIREQIESTLLQFENIEEVSIAIEGSTEEVLQP